MINENDWRKLRWVYLEEEITKNSVLDYMLKGIKGIFEIDIEF